MFESGIENRESGVSLFVKVLARLDGLRAGLYQVVALSAVDL